MISTWKQFWYHKSENKYRQDQLADYLDKVLKEHGLRVTAKTYEDNPFQRGKGILDYLEFLKRNGVMVNRFVIIDDLYFDYKQIKLVDKLVKTDSKYGLRKRHILKAISILKGKQRKDD